MTSGKGKELKNNILQKLYFVAKIYYIIQSIKGIYLYR